MPIARQPDCSTRSQPARSANRTPRRRFGAVRVFDLLLVAVVGALGAFVAYAAITRRSIVRHSPAPPPVAAAPSEPAVATPRPAAAVDSSHSPAPVVGGDRAVFMVKSSAPPPARDMNQIRALLAETPGTYMADMVQDLGHHLIRWPDRRQEGLRIWVQTSTTVPDWDQRYAQKARDAFDDWGRDSELPIRFDYILDSATADIRILWVERFPADKGRRVGLTRWTYDQYGWLVSATIDVAIHDSTGKTIPPASLVGIMRHEAGHALGMGHSGDPRTKMYPEEIMSEITSADRSTLRLLYSIPPGTAP